MNLRTRHSLSILLFYLGLSRSGYYKWKKSAPKQDSNEDIVEYIKAIHSLRPFYGYRRITTTLHREGLIINHKRVHRLMQQLGIQSVIRKKRRYVGKSGSIVFPNLLGRDFKSDVPDKNLRQISPICRQAPVLFTCRQCRICTTTRLSHTASQPEMTLNWCLPY